MCARVLMAPQKTKNSFHPKDLTSSLAPTCPAMEENAKAVNKTPQIAGPSAAPKNMETAEGIMENVPPKANKITIVARVNKVREKTSFEYKIKKIDCIAVNIIKGYWKPKVSIMVPQKRRPNPLHNAPNPPTMERKASSLRLA